MATNIYNYDGTLRTTIPDNALDSTTSINMPGRGYLNYGEDVNQDMLWIMQNFANATSPTNPVTGQIWYNTANGSIYIYNGTSWLSAGGAVIAGTAPTGQNPGTLWYDSVNKQLNVYSGTAWLLVGPLGSAVNADPNATSSTPLNSVIRAVQITDTSSVNHQAWEIFVGGTLIAILSTDTPYSTSISGFSTVNPGMNISTAVPNSGVTSPTAFTSLKTNLPATDNLYNMGSASYRFANIYAVAFNGQATSALYADLAERYQSDTPLEQATVVCLGGTSEVTACMIQGTEDIFGVVSTNPAYLMNSGAGDDDTHPAIAIMGRVPCKVVGPVQKGQRLMASAVRGCACAYNPEYGVLAILGRALVDKTTAGIDTIEIVIGKN